MTGAEGTISEDPHDFNWGRARTGCNNLVCTKCQETVSWEVSTRTRRYTCSCTKWDCRFTESVTEYYTMGPADIPVEMPPWRCAGHPQRQDSKPLTESEVAQLKASEDSHITMAQKWEGAYFPWAHSPRGVEVLALIQSGDPLGQLTFYGWNPTLDGATRTAGLVSKLQNPEHAGLAARTLAQVYKASSDPIVLKQLQQLALRKDWASEAIPYLDKSWLRQRANDIVKADPSAAAALCSRAGRADIGWDQHALKTLPVEVLRAGAAKMPRSRLRAEELEVYWERDYEWLSSNLPKLCEEASDFYFYFEDFLLRHGWEPSPRIVSVWRAQAFDTEHAYNSLPPLVRFDAVWVTEHLGEIIDKSQTRGVWLVDKLRQAGVDIEPLLPVLKERDPKDLESHLPLWFPDQ